MSGRIQSTDHSSGVRMQRQQARPSLLMPAFDDEVRDLAAEISEARVRLGIPDQDVFGGGGLFSLRTLQLQLREAGTTVQEGLGFFSLGVRMLASDAVYSGQLFTRALVGNTLRAREVSVRAALCSVLCCIVSVVETLSWCTFESSVAQIGAVA